MEEEENKIRPPSFPLTIGINQAITDFYFGHFVQKYLAPLGLGVEITGRDRDQVRNAQVGGAENSAHLHGLAVDFRLTRAGVALSPADSSKIFTTLIKPNWPGFAQDEMKDKNHIHVNLSRAISITTGLTAASVMGILAIPLFKKFFKPLPKR